MCVPRVLLRMPQGGSFKPGWLFCPSPLRETCVPPSSRLMCACALVTKQEAARVVPRAMSEKRRYMLSLLVRAEGRSGAAYPASSAARVVRHSAVCDKDELRPIEWSE